MLDVSLDGADGADWVAGTPQRDTLAGGAGADVLLGRDGEDFLTGDPDDVVAAGRRATASAPTSTA